MLFDTLYQMMQNSWLYMFLMADIMNYSSN